MVLQDDEKEFAMKHYQFAGTVHNAVERGIKAGDNRKTIFKNLEQDLEYYNESMKQKITKILKEEVDKAKNINIKLKGDDVADVTIEGFNLNGSEVINIKKIVVGDNFKSLQTIIDVVGIVMDKNPDVNKFVVSPFEGVVNMVFDGGFWEKVGFTKLNDNFLIKMRGH